MINIVKDVDLIEHVNEYDIILVGTNVYNSLSQGFAWNVRRLYPFVQAKNMETKYGDVRKMGTLLECKEEGLPTFVLCYITKGYNFRPDIEKDYLSYESLEKCLKLVNVLYKGKNIAAPFLGTSRFDGNGNAEKIMEIFNNTCHDINITLYDFYQLTEKEFLARMMDEERKMIEKDRKKGYDMIRKRKEKNKELKNLKGYVYGKNNHID